MLGGASSNFIARIDNSFSSGEVSGVTNVGGLAGDKIGLLEVINSYWNIETSGQTQSDGGTGKTTAELQQIMTFTSWDIADVSDLTSNSIWVIDENNKTPWLRYNH